MSSVQNTDHTARSICICVYNLLLSYNNQVLYQSDV